jgi:hypothetical protein
MRIASIFILGGLLLFAFACALPAYKDEQAYMQKYLALDGPDRNERFHALREESLSAKFQLQDYGLTLASLGLVLLVVLRRGWRAFCAPKTRTRIAMLGLLAALATVLAGIGSLELDFDRGEFPDWADSLAIPLMGAPFLLLALAAWAGLHIAAMRGPFVPGVPLTRIRPKSAWWLASLSLVTLLSLALAIAGGAFWYVVPGALWLYYYLSLMAGRSQGRAPIAPQGAAACATPREQ